MEARGGRRAVLRNAWWRGAPLALAASIVVVAGVAGVPRACSGRGPIGCGDGRRNPLVAPGAAANANAPIAFAWRAVPKASRYVLEMQREDGSVALTDTTADTVLTIAPSAALLPDSSSAGGCVKPPTLPSRGARRSGCSDSRSLMTSM